jgi:hypothetical protein
LAAEAVGRRVFGRRSYHSDGWSLTVDPALPPAVRRVIDIVGVADMLWPA